MPPPAARRTLRRALLLGPAVGLALLVTGCSQGSDPGTVVVTPDRPVLQPGAPGEANTTHTGPVSVTVPRANAADARFMSHMVAHHAQALELVDLARDELRDEQVRALADRIRSAQQPELQVMAAWLVRHEQPVPAQAADAGVDVTAMGGRLAGGGHGDHGGVGGPMAGMATEQDLQALGQARGPDADILFLQLMVAHHEGALEMAVEHAGEASDVQAQEMSNGIYAEQMVEIARMEEMLVRLG
jgi:uncharacterized protein (DUF305 family)